MSISTRPAHGARRLEGVVQLGELGMQQRLAGVTVHEPQVLVGGDVAEVPYERAHQLGVGALEVRVADRRDERERPLAGPRQRRPHVAVVGARGEGRILSGRGGHGCPGRLGDLRCSSLRVRVNITQTPRSAEGVRAGVPGRRRTMRADVVRPRRTAPRPVGRLRRRARRGQDVCSIFLTSSENRTNIAIAGPAPRRPPPRRARRHPPRDARSNASGLDGRGRPTARFSPAPPRPPRSRRSTATAPSARARCRAR